MMALSSSASATLILLLGSLIVQDWERANEDVRRLEPIVFKQLPAPIVQDLRQRGCTVPQSFSATKPSGVIQGRFTSGTQVDWAVLCSVGRVSAILVFRGGSVSRIDELVRRPDSDFLQVIGPGNVVGFSRGISAAGPAYIRSYGGDAVLPPLDHDGIEDSFIEKGSTIWYWYAGRWLELPGAD